MAGNYWLSTQCNHWLLDRATLRRARRDDLKYASEDDVASIGIWCVNAITHLCKRLLLRQQVSATATVFLRRFYAKNAYSSSDPCLVIAACVYVAAKVEETPVHVKSVLSEARNIFVAEYDHPTFPTDNSALAEMEFYLLEELEFDLIVYHPYRSLVAICGREPQGSDGSMAGGPAGPVAAGAERGAGVGWTGEGGLDMDEGSLRMAWFLINDMYRTDIPLLYPPHLIAITAIYLTLVFHPDARARVDADVSSQQNSEYINREMEKERDRRTRKKLEDERDATLAASAAAQAHVPAPVSARQTQSPQTPSSASKPSPGRVPISPTSARLPVSPTSAFHPSTRPNLMRTSTPQSQSPSQPQSQPQSQSQSQQAAPPPPPLDAPTFPPDAITYLAGLNIDFSMVVEIAQEMLDAYEVWDSVECGRSRLMPMYGSRRLPVGSATAAAGDPAGAPARRTALSDRKEMVKLLGRMRTAWERDVEKVEWAERAERERVERERIERETRETAGRRGRGRGGGRGRGTRGTGRGR